MLLLGCSCRPKVTIFSYNLTVEHIYIMPTLLHVQYFVPSAKYQDVNWTSAVVGYSVYPTGGSYLSVLTQHIILKTLCTMQNLGTSNNCSYASYRNRLNVCHNYFLANLQLFPYIMFGSDPNKLGVSFNVHGFSWVGI